MGVVNCGSYLIRLRDSFIINISGNNWDLKTSYVKLVIRGRKHPRDYHFWLCVAMSTSCPIRLNNSFISINSFNNFMGIGKNVFDFLCGDNHQGKVASQDSSISADCVMSGVPLVQSNFRILRSTISSEGVKWYLCLTISIFFFFSLLPCIFYQT